MAKTARERFEAGFEKELLRYATVLMKPVVVAGEKTIERSIDQGVHVHEEKNGEEVCRVGLCSE